MKKNIRFDSFWAFNIKDKYRIQIYHPKIVLNEYEFFIGLNTAIRWSTYDKEWCFGLEIIGFGIGLMKLPNHT